MGRALLLLLAVAACGPRAAPVSRDDEPPTLPVAAPVAVTVEEVAAFPAAVHGLGFAPDGTLWFSDSYGQLDPVPGVYTLVPPYDGTPSLAPVEAARPSGLLIEGDQRYICDVEGDRIRHHDAALIVHASWEVTQPWNLERMRDGTLLATTNDGRVVRLEDDGSTTTIIDGLDAPFDLVEGADGTLWVSEQGKTTGRVRRWTLGGEVVQEASYAWDNPEGLAVDAAGDLWVTETGRGELIRIGADGVGAVIADGLSFPIALVNGPDGELWFNSNGDGGRLHRVALIPQ